MKSKYKVEKISQELAFKIWSKSPNSSIFNNPQFLSFYEGSIFFGAYKGDELLCCWPILLNNDEFKIPDFFYYLGPFWSNKFDKIPNHSKFSLTNDIYNCYINKFINKFKKIHFQLHYSLNDIRAFDWFNYNLNDSKKFLIKNRYTALIKNLKSKKPDKLLSDYRYVRRYEIKNFDNHKKNIIISDLNSTDAVDLYLENNYNADKNKDDQIKKDILKLIDISKKGYGDTISYKEKKTNKLVMFSLVLFDNSSVNLLINCATNEWKKKGIMAWSLNEKLKTYQKKYDIFDFNGANSPNRGDDKHSYGAKESLFFDLKYNIR